VHSPQLTTSPPQRLVVEPRTAAAGNYADWRRTLFPEATPDESADSHAQTLSYEWLFANLGCAIPLNSRTDAQAIHHSPLPARTQEIVTQKGTTVGAFAYPYPLVAPQRSYVLC